MDVAVGVNAHFSLTGVAFLNVTNFGVIMARN